MTDQKRETASRQPFGGIEYLVLAIIGALCGAALWFIFGHDVITDLQKPTLAAFVLSLAIGFTLIWRLENTFVRFGFILLQALLITALTFQFIPIGIKPGANSFVFWMVVGAPLLVFLLSAFARASLRERRLFWPYKALWQSGASLLADGLIAGGVGLAAVLFVALWGAAFKAFDMDWTAKIVHSPAFLLPLGGAAAALAGGLARSNEKLGEAVRSILLIGCRIGLPLAALFSLVFALGLLSGGVDSLEKVPLTPTGLLLALALISELIFNGVYQDGVRKPPNWLRGFSWVALAILPIYAVAAAMALWMRVDAYGLTPPRMIALIALTLTAAYTLLLLIGLVSEFFTKRLSVWMPPVAKLNTAMALVWIATLVLMHTPFLDPVVVSAKNQEMRLINGKTPPEKFDYGFLYFELGRPGRAAIARLETQNDSQILAGINRAKAASDYWSYKFPIADKAQPGEDAEQQALSQINALLAPTGMTMEDAAQFDYGALLYAKGDAGKKAFEDLAQWVENSAPADSGRLQVLRKRVGQGIIAARLANSLPEWQSAREAAKASMETFTRNVQDIDYIVGKLGEMAAKDRAARALFEKQTRNQEGIPSAQAMLVLLHAGAFVDQMDAEHLAELKRLLNGKTWFDVNKIGRAAEQDAWLIVLHANHDLDFQEQVLAAIEPRALAGQFDGRRYAHLYDIVARARGKPQRYGTKSLCEEGRWVADVTEDPERVDERRAQMGLPPLAQTLAQENARFGECHN
ncbi:MAG: DUF4153 domain-containing protein [Robiginitomaculum sp.]|nr:DUF4153 domain-containing protein [Robiginitomaculum sp.]MDQ7078987.1 DUF4153 domain-containing protein [Robiginitomaculum sp.]